MINFLIFFLKGLFNLKVISFGKHKKSHILLKKNIEINGNTKITANINNRSLNLQFRDINIYNVLASLAVLNAFKIDVQKIKSVLRNLQPSAGRGKKYNISRYKKNFKFIDESYNANPLSVKNAILDLTI